MSALSLSASLRAGFAALRSNLLRTALSALGVVIGIGAMISVLALSDGVEASIRQQLAADGRALTLRISARTTEMVDGVLLPLASFPTFGPSDATDLANAIGRGGTVNLSVSGPSLVAVAPGRPERGMMLNGMQRPPAAIADRPRLAGRFFTPEEAASGARVLVLSDGMAAALARALTDTATSITPVQRGDGPRRAAPGRPVTEDECRALVGRTVLVRGAPWRIVGVFRAAEGQPGECGGTGSAPVLGVGSGLGRTAAAPAAAALEAIVAPPGRPTAPTLVVSAERIEDVPVLRARAERWLGGRFGRDSTGPASWKRRIELASYERESNAVREGMLMFRILMSAITGISLVVGGVGIMNVLLASVTERTREIGISKAVGARSRDILTQYLAESVAISALGATLGTALGIGVAQLVAAVMRARTGGAVHAGFSLSTFLVAVGAPVIVGLCFGLYPALRASRLSPIDAIRHE